MSYKVLIGEMAKEKITIEAISKCINVHRNSVSYKLNEGNFDIDEALKIHSKFFPEWQIEALFKKE